MNGNIAETENKKAFSRMMAQVLRRLDAQPKPDPKTSKTPTENPREKPVTLPKPE